MGLKLTHKPPKLGLLETSLTLGFEVCFHSDWNTGVADLRESPSDQQESLVPHGERRAAVLVPSPYCSCVLPALWEDPLCSQADTGLFVWLPSMSADRVSEV